MKSTLHTDKTLCGSDTYLSYFPRIRCHADMKAVLLLLPPWSAVFVNVVVVGSVRGIVMVCHDLANNNRVVLLMNLKLQSIIDPRLT